MLPDRFWSKVRYDFGCWEWTANKDTSGYGQFRLDGRLLKAHRLAYSDVSVIPAGYVLDHLCRNRSCVNPDHLECITALENTQRGTSGHNMADKTLCPKGHEYAGTNLIIKPCKYGKRINRVCRICSNNASRIKQALLRQTRAMGQTSCGTD